MLGGSRHGKFNERDEENERFCRLERDLELEPRDRRRERDRDNREGGSASGGDHSVIGSN